MSDRPTKQRSFLWQGVLILLPVIILAIVGGVGYYAVFQTDLLKSFTGVSTFLHKTISKDTFPIGSNKKIKSVSKNANLLI